MKLSTKIQTAIFMLTALTVPGSAIASTNLTCKVDCLSRQTQLMSKNHACCPKINSKIKVTEKISVKCDNCLESRDVPVALNPSTDLKQIEAVVLYEIMNPGAAIPAKAAQSQNFFLNRNRFHQPKSVSITLHRFLI